MSESSKPRTIWSVVMPRSLAHHALQTVVDMAALDSGADLVICPRCTVRWCPEDAATCVRCMDDRELRDWVERRTP